MPERQFIPSQAQIIGAEQCRTRGHVLQAMAIVKPAVENPLDNFTQLELDEKQRLLMASRIYVVASTSYANRKWSATGVSQGLNNTRDAIINIYRDPQVQATVGEIKTDTMGNSYEFSTEMARDEVAYTVILAALTGNSELLTIAINRMDEIVEKAQEPAAKTLAQFDQQRLLLNVRESETTFQSLSDSYQSAIEASSAAKSWERVATVASRYAVDAARTGHIVEAGKGLLKVAVAARHDKATITILPRQIVRAATESLRHTNWKRTTPKESDYSKLILP